MIGQNLFLSLPPLEQTLFVCVRAGSEPRPVGFQNVSVLCCPVLHSHTEIEKCEEEEEEALADLIGVN